MKAGKVWGQTETLLSNPFVEVHRLVIEPNGQCSMHKHAQKANFFLVIHGHLRVHVEKADYTLTDTTDLRTGDCMEVLPGEYHRFHAVTRTECLEIYYPLPLAQDIQRRDCGAISGKTKGVEWCL